MFFVLVLVLAVIGLVSLLSGGAGGLAALLAVPILLLKLLLIMAVIGFFARRCGRGWHDQAPRRRSRPGRRGRVEEPETSDEDRFDEWHRMAHAREEVDRWVEDLPDFEAE